MTLLNQKTIKKTTSFSGIGLHSGQITNIPLTVQIKFDDDLTNDDIGDEDFINDVKKWEDNYVTKSKKILSSQFDKIFKSDQRGKTQ